MEAILNSITPVLLVDEYVDNTLVNMVEVEMNTSTSSSGSEKENKKAKTGKEEENEMRLELNPKIYKFKCKWTEAKKETTAFKRLSDDGKYGISFCTRK